MKSVMQACLAGAILACGGGGQEPQRPPLTKGVSVQMAAAGHAVEMRAADDPNATVVAITASGKVYAGIEVTEPGALGNLSAETVFVKVDARATYQTLLAVLDALRGKSVVLLTESPATAASNGYTPPYGIRLNLSR